ncbi:MAG: hypothetical protein E3J54_03430, partial [Actinobacteria bacterium]
MWAYTISYATIDITPNEQQIIASDKPTISVDWPYALGASLKKARVILDGRDISKEIKINNRGFIYKTPKKLSEGIHVINAQLEYDLIFRKKVSLKWFFSTDTVAPKIVLNERRNVLASRTPTLNLKGYTEPLSELTMEFNSNPPIVIDSNKRGVFASSIKGLKKKNDLLLTSKDRAGNVTKRKLTVIIDTNPPIVKKVNPGNGKLLFSADKEKLKAVLLDKESGISKATLLIDGNAVKTRYNKEKDVLFYEEGFKKDGVHSASLEVIDVAGNKVNKDWKFKVDTGKIIIDQSDFKLYHYKGVKLTHTLSVAVGMPAYATPNGNWKIVRKKPMPAWYNPMKGWSSGMPRVIPPGPRNPLGLRALYLDASGIRIHGTSAYYSIGRRASHGCIRVRNPEIVAFYPRVEVGTPVIIRP